MATECFRTSLGCGSSVSQMWDDCCGNRFPSFRVQTWYQSQDTFYHIDFFFFEPIKQAERTTRDTDFWCAQAERRITIKRPSVSPRLLCGFLLPAIRLMQICCVACLLRSYCVRFLLFYCTQCLDMTHNWHSWVDARQYARSVYM